MVSTASSTISTARIPDYPKPGIMFRDITTPLGDARSFRRAVDELCATLGGRKMTRSPASRRADSSWAARSRTRSRPASCRSARRATAAQRVSIAISLEYGLDEMEMHEDG